MIPKLTTMQRFLLIFLVFLSSSLIASPRETPSHHHITTSPWHQGTTVPSSNIDSLWPRVDSLARAGLPNSALTLLDQIYTQAKSSGDDPQLVKTILYRISLTSTFQENALLLSIRDVRKELETSHPPVNQILSSILGELYNSYYRSNQYRLDSRITIAENVRENPETWDAKRFLWEIILNYRQSLSDETLLQGIPLEQYRILLEDGSADQEKKERLPLDHTTLFDFLSYRALQFFAGAEFPVIRSSTAFALNQPVYFYQTTEFIDYPMKPQGIHAQPGDGTFIPPGTDTLSLAWYAIRTYQALAAFHFNNKNPEALIYWELQRFSYVHEESVLASKDSLYLSALKKFERDYRFSPFSAGISFALAQELVKEGEEYDPAVSDAHRWQLKEALKVCEEAANAFPDSRGGQNCLSLSRIILAPSLSVTADYAVIPRQPALAALAYKNLSSLYFRLIKADPDTVKGALSGMTREEVFVHLTSRKAATQWEVPFHPVEDYQEHRTEIILPSISPGFYYLFASADSLFRNPSMPFAYQALWSSGISYITQRGASGEVEVFLLDRKTGSPLKEVVTELFVRSYDSRSRTYILTKTGEFKTDESGFFVIPPPGKGYNVNLILMMHQGDDLLISPPLYLYASAGQPVKPTEQTRFFTDRAIYRPGQPVYFKGVMLERTGDSTSLNVGKKTLITFTDANGQKITEQWFTTDAYGSFSGFFTAPTGVLPGEMRIFNESGSCVIEVEEYRRPTFEVSFEPVEGNYRLGESLTVSGKAAGYAGNAIDGGAVSYRVVRTATYPWWKSSWHSPLPVTPEVEIANGTVQTAKDGSFTITFTALPDYLISPEDQPVFNFQVSARVTDINGESRSAIESVSVGYTSLLINLPLPEKLNLKSDEPLKLTTTNLNDKFTPALVQITLQKLRGPGRALVPRSWTPPDTMFVSKEVFHAYCPSDPYANEEDPGSWPVEKTMFDEILNTASDSVISLTDTPSFSGIWHPSSGIHEPGSYKLILAATDPFGKKVKKVLFFTAFDPADKRVSGKILDWFVPLKSSGEPGETASFLIGTSEKEIHVIREIRLKNQLYSRERITLKNQQKVVEIPILEEFRGNVSVNFLFVYENSVFQHSQVITVPYTNKHLDIRIASFRDRLMPGRQEEWNIRITDAKGNGMPASLLASMYDRSLDLFRSHSWSFNLFHPNYYGNPWEVNHDFRTNSDSWHAAWLNGLVFRYITPYQLNWYGMPLPGFGSFWRGGYKEEGILLKNREMFAMEAEPGQPGLQEMPPPAMDEMNQGTIDEIPGDVSGDASKNNGNPVIPLRQNFNETAFFYPSLHSDSSGNLLLKFTVPEALTSWKLQGLAYTKNLDYGLIQKELVTQKELMVFPNVPRFVRQGDTVLFIARIVNLSDHEISGEANLALAEAITLQPLDELILDTGYVMRDPLSDNTASRIAHRISFKIPAGQSRSVSWTLAFPASRFISLLDYTITAQAGDFSDGEKNLLPVLSNRMMVTETLPLPVNGKGNYHFTFDRLLRATTLKSLSNYRLILEFASNPVWYAVQALPALNDQHCKNTDQVFSAFYANTLAHHIIELNPAIRPVFESWKTNTPDALVSNLEKNEALKSVLLQETPWVTSAINETESKQRLGLFFDGNNLRENLRSHLIQLQQMQYPSGGWPWFEGMRENRHVTLDILTGLGRLAHLGVKVVEKDEQVVAMAERAIRFLDGEFAKDYQQLQKQYPGRMNENHLDPDQVKYLYARSFFYPSGAPSEGSERKDITENQMLDEAIAYVISQAKSYWLKQDLVSQGMIALALFRMGNTEIPGSIIRSLSERALHSTEMGMYWASDAGFEWYQAPVEREALMIEAFDEITRDLKAVEEMKIWLLKQKQVTEWQTTRATVDACYALLLRGNELLTGDPQVQIRLGSTDIDPSRMPDLRQEAGTGYFTLSWTGDAILPEMGDVEVIKSTDGVAWGGLFWQYFENMDQITSYETPLKVEKEIFFEEHSDAGPVLVPITMSEGRGTSQNSSTTAPHHLGITSPLHHITIGDKLVVRLIVQADRGMDFVHLKDMRAAGLEPFLQSSSTPYPVAPSPLSGYHFQNGLGYYQSTTDLATNFFFDYLPKGTWVFEYPLVVNIAGDFSTGIATIQCMYAPEFSAHSQGERIIIKK